MFAISSNHDATKSQNKFSLTALDIEKWLTNYDCNRKKNRICDHSFCQLKYWFPRLLLFQVTKISEKFSYVISEVNLNCLSGTSDQMASGCDTLSA